MTELLRHCWARRDSEQSDFPPTNFDGRKGKRMTGPVGPVGETAKERQQRMGTELGGDRTGKERTGRKERRRRATWRWPTTPWAR